MTRPTLDEVRAYRSGVDRAMQAYLDSAGHALPAAASAAIELGLNHEQQHQELILTDIKHALAQNPLRPSYGDADKMSATVATRPMGWSLCAGGLKWVGHDGRGFAFDNEGPRHRVFLEEFQLGTRLVTSGEFLEFIEDNGYSRPEFWLSDGWNVVRAQQWEAPLYWERREGRWWVMTLGGFRRLTESEPVCHISFYEADASSRGGSDSPACPPRLRVGISRERPGNRGEFPRKWQTAPPGRPERHWNCSVLWRHLGVDPESLYTLSGPAAGSGCTRRVQCEVHV